MTATPDSSDIADRLRAQLPTDAEAVTAVILAGHRGDAATARAALTNADPHLRKAAIGAMERCGALTPPVLEPLLSDPDPRVRRRAAQAAAALAGMDLSTVILDTDPLVAEMAIWACGEHEQVSDHVLGLIIDATTSATEALVREAAAAALGAIGDERGLPAILAACADKPPVRRRAVLALAPFLHGPSHEAVMEAIGRALTDRDWQVRQAAEDISPEPNT